MQTEISDKYIIFRCFLKRERKIEKCTESAKFLRTSEQMFYFCSRT